MRLISLSSSSPRKRIAVALAATVIVIALSSNIVFAVQAQSPSPSQVTATSTPQPSATPSPSVPDWHKTIDSSQKIIAALAIIVGGFWAWLKFFRGRTFRSRLELTVSGRIVMSGDNKFLNATMEMKNVGLSQVKLKKDAIYLDVFLTHVDTVSPTERIYTAPWDQPVTFPVFADHDWVEPSEEISDQLLFQLPQNGQLACKLKLTVNSRGNSWVFFKTEGTRWSATAVLECNPPPATAESPVKKGS